MKNKEVKQGDMVSVWTRVILRVFFMIAGFIIAAWVLYQISTVLLLLIFSIFLCYLIAPLVRLVEHPVYLFKHKVQIPRGFAILIVYIIIGVSVFFAIRLVSPLFAAQAKELQDKWPEYKNGATKIVSDVTNWLRHLKISDQWQKDLQERGNHLVGSIGDWLGNLLLNIASYLPYLLWLIIVPIFSFFLLKDADKFEHGLVALFPTERMRKRVHWLLLDVSRTLAAYIRAQITACFEVGILVTIGLVIIDVPYAIVLGLMSGLLEFLPMIGPVVAAAIIFFLTLATKGGSVALVVLIFLALLRIVQDYIIYPRIVGQGIEMHPVIVITAILAGAELGGLIGVFLSIPTVGLLIVVYNHFVAHKGRQGEDGPVSPAQFARELRRDPRPELPDVADEFEKSELEKLEN
jgi:predicted PurR-regulated permease PerM